MPWPPCVSCVSVDGWSSEQGDRHGTAARDAQQVVKTNMETRRYRREGDAAPAEVRDDADAEGEAVSGSSCGGGGGSSSPGRTIRRTGRSAIDVDGCDGSSCSPAAAGGLAAPVPAPAPAPAAARSASASVPLRSLVAAWPLVRASPLRFSPDPPAPDPVASDSAPRASVPITGQCARAPCHAASSRCSSEPQRLSRQSTL